MTTYWIGSDKESIEYFIKFAEAFKIRIPKNASIISTVGDDGSLMGFGAVVSRNDLADLLFLYVIEEERRKGIGGNLLREIEEVALAAGVGSIRCIVQHEDTIFDFFEAEGYEFFETPKEYAVPIGSLHYSDSYRKNIEGKTPHKAKALDACSAGEKKILKEYFEEKRITDIDEYNLKLSAAAFEGNELSALLLCESNMEGIIINYMHADKEHPEKLVDCLKVLDAAISSHRDECKDLMLSFATGNEMELMLLKHLAGDAAVIEDFSRYSVAYKTLSVPTPEE